MIAPLHWRQTTHLSEFRWVVLYPVFDQSWIISPSMNDKDGSFRLSAAMNSIECSYRKLCRYCVGTYFSLSLILGPLPGHYTPL